MSIKTRIEKLEKAIGKNEPAETVIEVKVIVVRTREEVEALRAAVLRDLPQDNARPVPRGPVRLAVKRTVEAKDWLAARGARTKEKAG